MDFRVVRYGASVFRRTFAAALSFSLRRRKISNARRSFRAFAKRANIKARAAARSRREVRTMCSYLYLIGQFRERCRDVIL